jgi:hypothetical protein
MVLALSELSGATSPPAVPESELDWRRGWLRDLRATQILARPQLRSVANTTQIEEVLAG